MDVRQSHQLQPDEICNRVIKGMLQQDMFQEEFKQSNHIPLQSAIL